VSPRVAGYAALAHNEGVEEAHEAIIRVTLGVAVVSLAVPLYAATDLGCRLGGAALFVGLGCVALVGRRASDLVGILHCG
jgi:hypothetical protein